MKVIKNILPKLKDKYAISMLLFIVWISFFDDNNFIVQYHYKKKLSELQHDEEFYKKEIEKNKRDLYFLTSSPKNLEKFAREKFLMKKSNEDVFIFVDENNNRIEE